MNLTEAEEHNSFNHRKRASSATRDYRTESALSSGKFTYPGPRGPGTNNIVTFCTALIWTVTRHYCHAQLHYRLMLLKAGLEKHF